MSRLDDRLTRELERVTRPADPAGVFEQIDRRHTRRRRLHKVQSGALVAVVLMGTVGGFAVLSRAFREDGSGIGSAPVMTNGLVVYSEVRNAGQHLWVADPDGSGARQVTDGDGTSDSSPAVSPDGRTVAFARTDDSGSAIFAIGIDGTGLTRLSPPSIPATAPAWSPDGSEIAFAGIDSGIYVMSSNGGDARQIVHGPFVATYLSWSPDGTDIVFAAPSDATGADRNYDLWITDIEGVTQVNITVTAPQSELSPSWSPDGSLILFSRSSASGTSSSLMTMAPDPDSTPTSITDGSTMDQDPSWSPDGQRIVFDRTSAGGTAVYTMRPDGSDLRLVARNAVDPAWQPLLVGATGSTPTPSSTGPIDLGLAFPVCDPRTISADMDGDGTPDVVTIATKMSDAANCPARGTTTEILAVDLDGDGKADAVGGPLACPSGCEPFAAPDIDGDGRAEVAIMVDRADGGTERIQLWRLMPAPAGGSLAMVPFVDANGDPTTFTWGTLNNWGGNGPQVFGVSCTTRTTPPLVTAWEATPTGPTSFTVHEFGYHVVGNELRTAFDDNYQVPGEETVFPDGGGTTMCGAPVVAQASP